MGNNDEVETSTNKSGLFVWSNYQACFEAACKARDRAVKESSYQDFLECLSQGFASIESFLTTQAKIWNKSYIDDLLLDSTEKRVSLEDKVDSWIPKISGGKKLDKSGQVWYEFKILKKIRDDRAIHPKLVGQAISWEEIVKQINMFRLGIAQFLGCVHIIFSIPTPSVIINAIYMPNVEIITTSK